MKVCIQQSVASKRFRNQYFSSDLRLGRQKRTDKHRRQQHEIRGIIGNPKQTRSQVRVGDDHRRDNDLSRNDYRFGRDSRPCRIRVRNYQAPIFGRQIGYEYSHIGAIQKNRGHAELFIPIEKLLVGILQNQETYTLRLREQETAVGVARKFDLGIRPKTSSRSCHGSRHIRVSAIRKHYRVFPVIEKKWLSLRRIRLPTASGGRISPERGADRSAARADTERRDGKTE